MYSKHASQVETVSHEFVLIRFAKGAFAKPVARSSNIYVRSSRPDILCGSHLTGIPEDLPRSQ